MITIQPARKEDYNAIYEINVLAFGRENEARLVNTLRNASNFIPDFSLVALVESGVVGHILFTPIPIETKNGSLSALALAPIAVHPEFQKQGIGSELVRQGLERCRNGRA
jgi:putative acetyltransferase